MLISSARRNAVMSYVQRAFCPRSSFNPRNRDRHIAIAGSIARPKHKGPAKDGIDQQLPELFFRARISGGQCDGNPMRYANPAPTIGAPEYPVRIHMFRRNNMFDKRAGGEPAFQTLLFHSPRKFGVAAHGIILRSVGTDRGAEAHPSLEDRSADGHVRSEHVDGIAWSFPSCGNRVPPNDAGARSPRQAMLAVQPEAAGRQTDKHLQSWASAISAICANQSS